MHFLFQIMYPLFHVNRSSFGTYECRATDKSGNTSSVFIEAIPKLIVRAKMLEYNEEKVREGTCYTFDSLSCSISKQHGEEEKFASGLKDRWVHGDGFGVGFCQQ